MNTFALFLILIALGVIVGNIMLLKHSAKMKMSLKNFNQDPIEQAKKKLEERKQTQSETKSD